MRKETEINEMDGKLHEEYENRLQQALEELREVYDKQMLQSREDFEKLYNDRVSQLLSGNSSLPLKPLVLVDPTKLLERRP